MTDYVADQIAALDSSAFTAIVDGDMEMLKLAISGGACAENVLANAISLKSIEAVKIAFDDGHAKTAFTIGGRRPVAFAIYNNCNREILECLINHGADIDAQDNDGDTALIEAVRKKSAQAIDDLLDLGADPMIKNKKDEFPMALVQKDVNFKDKKSVLKKMLVSLNKKQSPAPAFNAAVETGQTVEAVKTPTFKKPDVKP